MIQGAVTDNYGNPLTGVLLQSPGLSPAVTDMNGNYSFGFISGSTFTITPSSGALIFLPSSTTYTNASNSITGQNYIGVATIAPTLMAGKSGTNLILGWQGLPDVSYQVYTSTNLVNWAPYGAALAVTNGPAQVVVPIGTNPQQFFYVQSSLASP